ncbi:MAG: hypothetical protein K2L97_03790 [Muribaculaceae bacterium]|nr:hypothetical protein [Muribaculaceae bacterium]
MTQSSDNKAILRFLRKTIIGGIPLGILLGVICYFYFFLRPQMVGDLGELGKIIFDRAYTERMYQPVLSNDMPLLYAPGDTLQSVVTVGDSFTQQRPNGYQSFLSEIIAQPITNISIKRGTTPEQALSDMINSGFFDGQSQVEWVILETVERELVDRWLMLDTTSTVKQFAIEVNPPSAGDGGDSRGFAGRIFKQGIDWLKIVSGLEESPVKSVRLSRDCFTEPGKEDMLYFYVSDLGRLSVTDKELAEVTKRIESMRHRLALRGIKMLFMVAPDKYELYQHLAVDNPHPVRQLGQQLLQLDSLGYVVNPLPELTRMTDAGEQDIFMADDSHWSPKASSTAARLIVAKMHSAD